MIDALGRLSQIWDGERPPQDVPKPPPGIPHLPWQLTWEGQRAVQLYLTRGHGGNPARQLQLPAIGCASKHTHPLPRREVAAVHLQGGETSGTFQKMRRTRKAPGCCTPVDTGAKAAGSLLHSLGCLRCRAPPALSQPPARSQQCHDTQVSPWSKGGGAPVQCKPSTAGGCMENASLLRRYASGCACCVHVAAHATTHAHCTCTSHSAAAHLMARKPPQAAHSVSTTPAVAWRGHEGKSQSA